MCGMTEMRLSGRIACVCKDGVYVICEGKGVRQSLWRVRDHCNHWSAVAELRKRGFTPLYRIKVACKPSYVSL